MPSRGSSTEAIVVSVPGDVGWAFCARRTPKWRTHSNNNESNFAFAASKLLGGEGCFHNSDKVVFCSWIARDQPRDYF